MDKRAVLVRRVLDRKPILVEEICGEVCLQWVTVALREEFRECPGVFSK